MNLIEQIAAAMADDDDNTDQQSELLVALYEQATPACKTKLDDAFICLCGWSLDTLLKRHANTVKGDR